MKQKWISVVVALALVAIGFGALPASKVRAAGAVQYYPAQVPGDATVSSGSLTAGTPFALYVTVTGLSGTCYGPKLYYPSTGASAAYTWNSDTWKVPSDTWTEYTIISGVTSWSGWVIGAIPSTATATGSIIVGIRCGTTNNYTTGVSVTKMAMTGAGDGGWLEETNGSARAGRAFVVKNGSTIVGMYVSEDNGVNEGYPATLTAAAAAPAGAGYSKVAVPVCPTCNYIIESWDRATPGTPVGQVNTMGSGACPNTVTAGSTTSLDACSAPTAITLRTLSATPQSAAAAPVIGLALLGGIFALGRRRRA